MLKVHQQNISPRGTYSSAPCPAKTFVHAGYHHNVTWCPNVIPFGREMRRRRWKQDPKNGYKSRWVMTVKWIGGISHLVCRSTAASRFLCNSSLTDQWLIELCCSVVITWVYRCFDFIKDAMFDSVFSPILVSYCCCTNTLSAVVSRIQSPKIDECTWSMGASRGNYYLYQSVDKWSVKN